MGGWDEICSNYDIHPSWEDEEDVNLIRAVMRAELSNDETARFLSLLDFSRGLSTNHETNKQTVD